MKKILAVLMAAVALVSLASCGGKTKPTKGTETTAANQLTLPGEDSKLFGSVPKPDAELTRTNTGRDSKGYVYQWEFKGMDYEGFKAYVAELKEAGFSYYSTSALAIVAKEPEFKKTAKEAGYTAGWLGMRKGLYVSAMWYGDEFFEKNKITGPNCRILFYTYNPFITEESSAKMKSESKKAQ